MLAEPRRKVRIGPNPRGKFFQEDDDNRGRQMLLKMGWKTGDGLGANSHGMSEPIKPKVNTDSRGLGFDKKQDPWVAHNEEFEQLLKTLNSNSSADEGLKNNTDEDSNDGLEKKSKGASRRIHYHKFVKNKDLSKASFKDMSCIFGKSLDESITVARKVSPEDIETPVEPIDTAEPAMVEENGSEDPCNDDEKSKKKKKKKRNKDKEVDEVENNIESVPDPVSENPMVEENVIEAGNDAALENIENNESTRKEKKKKKRNKDKEVNEDENNIESFPVPVLENPMVEEKVIEAGNDAPLENIEDIESTRKEKKKKKKRKHRDDDESIAENNLEAKVLVEPEVNEIQMEGSELADRESKERKKKKKSKKRKREEEMEEYVKEEEEPPISTGEILLAPGSEQTDSVDAEMDSEVNKKKKKKRKKDKDQHHTNDEEGATTSSNDASDQPENEPNKEPTPLTQPGEAVEKLGSMQFINRGSIDDYFRMKKLQMQQRLAMAAKC